MCAHVHPSLAFYRGERPVVVRLPRHATSVTCHDEGNAGSIEDDDNKDEDEVTMYVVQLHQRLMPPAALGADAAANHEYYAQAIASNDGLEVLRRNWRLLLALLFVRVPADLDTTTTNDDDDTSAMHASRQHDDNNSSRSSGSSDAVTSCVVQPIRCVDECVRHRLTTADVRGLREPAMMDRVHYSYIVVLRFFGWRIHDDLRGVLDRHRGWHARYAQLAMQPNTTAYRVVTPTGDDADDGDKATVTAPRYGETNWYASALPHVLHSLLDLGFVTYAVRLADFLVEELRCGRLLFLRDWVACAVLQPLYASASVDVSHKRRLRRSYRRLTCSDSDEWSSSDAEATA